MTNKPLILLATLGSLAMILGALGFEHLGGMAPCKLCYWQRYGHYLAIALGVLALIWQPRGWILWLGGIAAASSSVVAVYHSGVERKWWAGPSSCTGGSVENVSVEDLIAQINAAPMVRCDDIPWQMFGLTMANLNIVGSAALALIWVLALKAR